MTYTTSRENEKANIVKAMKLIRKPHNVAFLTPNESLIQLVRIPVSVMIAPHKLHKTQYRKLCIHVLYILDFTSYHKK